MKRHIFSLFFLFIAVNGYAQYHFFEPKYSNFMWKADSLYKINKLLNAAISFEKAGKSQAAPVFKWIAYLNASKSYSKVGHLKKSFHNYEKSAKFGLRYSTVEQIQNDSLIIPFKKKSRWKRVENKIKENILAFSNPNRDLQIQLQLLYKKDQYYRGNVFSDSLRKIYGNQKSDSILSKEISKQDADNQLQVKNILKTYGWPGRKLVGDDGDQTMWVIIQHADTDIEFQKHCLKLIINSIKKQETRIRNYAYLIDRIRKNEGKSQVFGTQFEMIAEPSGTKKLLPYKIEDTTVVDKLRLCFGLESLNEYLTYATKRYGVK